MVVQVFNAFIAVLGRCASLLFNLPITDNVSLGSFMVVSAILGAIISVIFSGLRAFLSLYSNSVFEGEYVEGDSKNEFLRWSNYDDLR